jgi:6-pyruvoyltetrahydropterin/6-carboxytetrahydropterin synthase
MYYSEKTLGHDRGYSCVFRQKNAVHSHCSLFHGYALGFTFKWRSRTLDECNWVYDFGGLKEFKKWLDYNFDHTFLVTSDDPMLETILRNFSECADIRVIKGSGCEMFASWIFENFHNYIQWVKNSKLDQSVYITLPNGQTLFRPSKPIGLNTELYSVTVSEHAGNSATYCIE